MRFADLHLHTHHSDGLRSPHEVIELAAFHQLGIIAISDHDNLAAIDEATVLARKKGIQVIPAVELSTEYENVDLHLLAYGFDHHDVALEARLERFRRARLERGERMVERLIQQGCSISLGRVHELRGTGALGRPHIARALVEAGVSVSVDDAFEKWLSPGCPGYVEKERFPAGEAIEVIRAAGGLTSIAHPTLYPDFQRLVRQLFERGADAVEAFHPQVNEISRAELQQLAKAHRKFVTGGSDDHGFEDLRTIGTIRLPEVEIAPLLSRVA